MAPFKSSLFGIAENLPPGIELVVQPVSITYTRALDGTPLVGRWRELYCWFGEATMLPHLMRMVSLPGAEVELRFHEPIMPPPAWTARNSHGVLRRRWRRGLPRRTRRLVAEGRWRRPRRHADGALSSAPDAAAV